MRKLKNTEFINKMDALGGKWKLYIIFVLHNRRNKFNKVKHALGSITSRVLSKSLNDLIKSGVVIKEKDKYLLTSTGLKIAVLIDQLFTLIDQLD